MPSNYLVNRLQSIDGYNVIKCDEDFNYIEGYIVAKERGKWFCDCPNTLAPVCRHMKMIEIFRKKRAIGKGMFYCYETGEWTKAKEFK